MCQLLASAPPLNVRTLFLEQLYSCQQDGTKDGKPFTVRDCTVPDDDEEDGDRDAGGSSALDTCGGIPARGCVTPSWWALLRLMQLCLRQVLHLGVQDAQIIREAMAENMMTVSWTSHLTPQKRPKRYT